MALTRSAFLVPIERQRQLGEGVSAFTVRFITLRLQGGHLHGMEETRPRLRQLLHSSPAAAPEEGCTGTNEPRNLKQEKGGFA